MKLLLSDGTFPFEVPPLIESSIKIFPLFLLEPQITLSLCLEDNGIISMQNWEQTSLDSFSSQSVVSAE